jgi:hypothetical protein
MRSLAPLLLPGLLLAAGCDAPGLFGPVVSPALATTTPQGPSGASGDDITARVNALVAGIPKDVDLDQAVLDVAANDLACPRSSVAVAMKLDRRFANGVSLRYIVEGCGTRALYAEDCSRSSTCEYALASRQSLDTVTPIGPAVVPVVSTPPSPLPAELAGLSVRIEPHVTGTLVGDQTMEKATDGCRHGDADLVHALGWTVAEDPAKADLVVRFVCGISVGFESGPGGLVMHLPTDGARSTVLSAAGHALVTAPASPSRLTCQSSEQDAQADCTRRASAMGTARLEAAIAGSAELKAYVEERRGMGGAQGKAGKTGKGAGR